MRKKMIADDIQKAEDRRILQKLVADQELTEEEDKRLNELMCIAANNLGMKWPAQLSQDEVEDHERS